MCSAVVVGSGAETFEAQVPSPVSAASSPRPSSSSTCRAPHTCSLAVHSVPPPIGRCRERQVSRAAGSAPRRRDHPQAGRVPRRSGRPHTPSLRRRVGIPSARPTPRARPRAVRMPLGVAAHVPLGAPVRLGRARAAGVFGRTRGGAQGTQPRSAHHRDAASFGLLRLPGLFDPDPMARRAGIVGDQRAVQGRARPGEVTGP